jgi:hypothetical protein
MTETREVKITSGSSRMNNSSTKVEVFKVRLVSEGRFRVMASASPKSSTKESATK